MQNRSHAYIEPLAGVMTPAQLRAWRKARGLIQRDMGALLGLSIRAYKYLELGDTRAGRTAATIPRQTELALAGLDMEMKHVFGAEDLPALKAAYAKMIVNLERTTTDKRHDTLGRLGREIIKKRA